MKENFYEFILFFVDYLTLKEDNTLKNH